MASSIESILEKFAQGRYSLYSVQSVMSMDTDGVFVNENAPYIDIVQSIENEEAMKANVLMPRLKASSYGCWTFRALLLPTDYFESRESLDAIVIEKDKREVGTHCIQASKISIREAIEAMRVELSCNVGYCLQNKIELENELDYKLPDDFDANDALALKKFEQEIFYKTMCKVFGSECGDDEVEVDGNETLYEKSFMIRDFNILSFDGNFMLASATRGNYYFVFYFEY